MQTSKRGILGGILVASLSVAAFGLGNSLRPDRTTATNLYHPHSDLTQTAMSGSTILASFPTAKTSGPRASIRQAADDSGADDVVSDGPGATFDEVYQLLRRNYVEGIPNESKLGHGAAAAMLASLGDPESRFEDAPQMKELQSEIAGVYRGIGAVTDVRTLKHGDPNSKDDPGYTEYRLTVVSALPGSPAEKAGLRPDDVITELNGKWIATYDPVAAATKDLKAVQDDPVSFNKLASQIQKKVDNAISLSDAEDQLRQTASQPMTLTVERPGSAKPFQASLDVSTQTTVTPITARSLPNGVGYIKINQLTDGSDKDFATALSGFGNDIKGLVLDLRDTPGGQIAAAKAIAEKISTGRVLAIDQKKGKQESTIALTPAKSSPFPVAVLIDGGTASTAEVLASELHDNGCKLIGQTTFGDPMEVAPVILRDGSGFTMTVGQFYTASHGSLAQGVKPDIAVADTASPDDAINQAIGVLSGRVAIVPSNRG